MAALMATEVCAGVVDDKVIHGEIYSYALGSRDLASFGPKFLVLRWFRSNIGSVRLVYSFFLTRDRVPPPQCERCEMLLAAAID